MRLLGAISLSIAIIGVPLGCAREGDSAMQTSTAMPKLTRENLQSLGFKPSQNDPDSDNLENVPLADVSRKLGFSLADLQPTRNQPPHSDVRTVNVRGMCFIVRSEVRNNQGNIVPHSLDNPDAICSISVSFKQISEPRYKPTDNSPRMSIRSIAVPQQPRKGIQLTFELAAGGEAPVAVSQQQFSVQLSRANQLSDTYTGQAQFSKETPQVITVLLGNPVVLSVDAFTDGDNGGLLTNLPSGEYVVHIEIGGRKSQEFDYQWTSRPVHSDQRKVVLD